MQRLLIITSLSLKVLITVMYVVLGLLIEKNLRNILNKLLWILFLKYNILPNYMKVNIFYYEGNIE